VTTIYCFEEWRGEQRISPPGVNFTAPGDKVHHGGTTSPLGSKFVPMGEVKNGPLGEVGILLVFFRIFQKSKLNWKGAGLPGGIFS
jgi:hypothetical protein